MNEIKYSDEQIRVLVKGLLKTIIAYPFCWLAAHGVGTKMWKNAQFVRTNNALMDMWNGYTAFGNRLHDDIQENEWDEIENLQKTITDLADIIQDTSYEVFRFKEE